MLGKVELAAYVGQQGRCGRYLNFTARSSQAALHRGAFQRANRQVQFQLQVGGARGRRFGHCIANQLAHRRAVDQCQCAGQRPTPVRTHHHGWRVQQVGNLPFCFGDLQAGRANRARARCIHELARKHLDL